MIDLTGIALKLLRADTHREELKSLIEAFVDSKPYDFYVQLDQQASAWVIRVKVLEEPPLMLGIIVGDIVHNIRSALDHLACQFVLHSGNKPTTRTAFPLFDKKPKPGSKAEKRWNDITAGMNAEALEYVDHFQPYHTAAKPEPHLLSMLNILWNWDKHHDIHVVGHAFDGLNIVGTASMHFAYVERPGFTGLRDGAEVGRFLIDPNKPGGKLQFDIAGGFSMAFENPEKPIINGLEITRLLDTISAFVSLDMLIGLANNFPTVDYRTLPPTA
jgi:hypothetical protein